MRDTEFYRQILGIESPWEVSRVELSAGSERVDVWVDHRRGVRWKCPECDEVLPTYDHGDEREWRHLDTCQFFTYLHAKVPRIKCPLHGVLRVRLPWAEPMSRFTKLFERLAIDVLKECDVLGASRLLRTTWDETMAIMHRAVERGMLRRPATVAAHLGVDEKAARKGHDYITVVTDLDRSTVQYIATERKQSSLDGYFDQLTDKQKEGIEAVAMDMWEPYANSVRAHLCDPDQKIVFDRFHLMGYLGKAVDTVRKQENRALLSAGDKSLVGTKYLFLYSAENLPDKHKERFDTLRGGDLKTSRAWAIKESLRWFWDYQRKANGEQHFKSWYFWATHSRLQPIIDAAKTLMGMMA